MILVNRILLVLRAKNNHNYEFEFKKILEYVFFLSVPHGKAEPT